MVDFHGYKVFEDGTVIGLKNKLIKFETTKNGYKRFSFVINGSKKRYLIHRLVMTVFVGDSNLDVNHKNGDKSDNRLSNLEYVTRKENIQHSWEKGLSKKRFGDKMHTSKISDKDVLFIRMNKGFLSGKELSEMFGITRASVYRIQNNKSRYATT